MPAGYGFGKYIAGDSDDQRPGKVNDNQANAGRHFAFMIMVAFLISTAAAVAVGAAHEGSSANDVDSARDNKNNAYALGWWNRHKRWAFEEIIGYFMSKEDMRELFWHGVSLHKRGYMWSVCKRRGKKWAVHGTC